MTLAPSVLEQSHQNLYQLLRGRFGLALDRPCIHTAERSWRYGEVEAMAGRMANALRAAGAAPGDRVAVQVQKSAEAVCLYLATLRAGCVYLPLNTAYPASELDYFIGDAEPAVVVCEPGRANEVTALADAHGARVMTLGSAGDGTLMTAVRSCADDFETHTCDGDTLAAILYTSGTTGRPKGAMLSHANLASNALVLHQHWGFEPDDVLLHALPIFHTHGLFVALNTSLLNATAMHLLRRYDVHEVMRLLPECRVFMGVPTFYVRLLDEAGFGPDQCANMRLFVSGSAPLLAQTHAEFEQRTGHVILERYGMTECGHDHLQSPTTASAGPAPWGFQPCPEVEVPASAPRSRRTPLPDRRPSAVLELKGPERFQGLLAQSREDGGGVHGPTASSSVRRPRRSIDDRRATCRIVGRAKDLDHLAAATTSIPRRSSSCHRRPAPGWWSRRSSACPTRTSARRVGAVVIRGARPQRARRRGDHRRPQARAWPASRCPSTVALRRRACPATPWARSRRTCFETGSRRTGTAVGPALVSVELEDTTSCVPGLPFLQSRHLRSSRVGLEVRQYHERCDMAAKKAARGPSAIRAKQTKTQIISSVAEETGLTKKEVQGVLSSLAGVAHRHVMKRGSGEFAVPELGLKIRRVQRKARTARNPMTGEAIKVPARTAVKATVLKSLKDVAA